MFGLSKNERKAKKAAEFSRFYFDGVYDYDLMKEVATKEQKASPAGVAALTHLLIMHDLLHMNLHYDVVHEYLQRVEKVKYWTQRALDEGDMNGYDFLTISTAVEMFKQALATELNLRKKRIGESNYIKIKKLFSSPPKPFDDD